MKKLLFLIISLACFSYVFAQGDVKNVVNDANAEVREVGDFTGVDVSSAIKLYLSQGSECAVAVSCEDKSYNAKIKTEVKNGVLKISLENGSWNTWNWKDRTIRAYVTVKDINTIRSSGASTVRLNEVFKVSSLKIDVNGASSFKGTINGGTIKIDASGASSITIDGSTSELDVEASGASSVKAYDFVSNKCVVDCSGASSVGVNVKNELKAEASGASSVRYKGNPSNKSCESSGASSIKQRAD